MRPLTRLLSLLALLLRHADVVVAQLPFHAQFHGGVIRAIRGNQLPVGVGARPVHGRDLVQGALLDSPPKGFHGIIACYGVLFRVEERVVRQPGVCVHGNDSIDEVAVEGARRI